MTIHDSFGGLYIYKAMAQAVGHEILEQKFAQLSQEKRLSITVDKKALWLLRESNRPGMLTIDYLYWNQHDKTTYCASVRFALVEDGWICATDLTDAEVQKRLKCMKKVTAESVGLYEQSLQARIDGCMLFLLANRVNPLKSEQSTAEVYSRYTVRINEVSVLPALTQAITCERTQKPFRDPVVLKKNIEIKDGNGTTFRLYRGRSYERSALEKLNIAAADYIKNFLLSRVIDRIGFNNIEKLTTLSEDRLEDAVSLEIISEPVILPSGHSVARKEAEKILKSHNVICPLTRMPFSKADLIPNIHLDRFIKAWTDCKEMHIAKLEDENTCDN